MKNQDLQGISVARNVVSYRVYHNHEEDDITYYSNTQMMQDKYVWATEKSQPLLLRFHNSLLVVTITTIIQSEPLNLTLWKFRCKERYGIRSY
jgi:hypothetical protein